MFYLKISHHLSLLLLMIKFHAKTLVRLRKVQHWIQFEESRRALCSMQFFLTLSDSSDTCSNQWIFFFLEIFENRDLLLWPSVSYLFFSWSIILFNDYLFIYFFLRFSGIYQIFRMLLLVILNFLPQLSSFLEIEADIHRKCFTCSVFTFINNKLLCANPGVCYSQYCYTCKCFFPLLNL